MPSLFRKKVAAAVAAVAAASDEAGIWQMERGSGVSLSNDGGSSLRNLGLRMGVVLSSEVLSPENAYRYDAYWKANFPWGNSGYVHGFQPGGYLGEPTESPWRKAFLGVPRLSQLVSLDVEGFLRGDAVVVPGIYAADNAFRGDTGLVSDLYDLDAASRNYSLRVSPVFQTDRIGDFAASYQEGEEGNSYGARFPAYHQQWKRSVLFGPTPPVLSVSKSVPVIKNKVFQVVTINGEPVAQTETPQDRRWNDDPAWDYSYWVNWDLAGPGTHIEFSSPQPISSSDTSGWQSRIRSADTASQKSTADVTTHVRVIIFPAPGYPVQNETGSLGF